MSDSGLSARLRQQSRRAGLMVGFTMVLAMTILIFGAAGLFAWLSRPFSDLIPMVAPAAEMQATEPQIDSEAAAVAPTESVIQTDAEPEPAEPTPPPPTAEPEETEFEATHQISANQSVNIRTGPSTNDSVIVALSPGTPLQYLDEDEPASESADGNRWMFFRTEDGQEGWVLELLVVPYQP
jgi:hypothetical protein